MTLESLDMVLSVEPVDSDVLMVMVKLGSAYHFEDIMALHGSYRIVDHSITAGTYWITTNESLP